MERPASPQGSGVYDAIYGVRSRYENGARIGWRDRSLFHGGKWKIRPPLHWRIDSHSRI